MIGINHYISHFKSSFLSPVLQMLYLLCMLLIPTPIPYSHFFQKATYCLVLKKVIYTTWPFFMFLYILQFAQSLQKQEVNFDSCMLFLRLYLWPTPEQNHSDPLWMKSFYKEFNLQYTTQIQERSAEKLLQWV